MPESLFDPKPETAADPAASQSPAGTENPPASDPPADPVDPPAGGENQLPEWIAEKFRTTENPVEAQAKAYGEAVKALTQKTDTLRDQLKGELTETIRKEVLGEADIPEAVDGYTLPEGLSAEDKVLDAFREVAAETKLSRKQFEALAKLHADMNTVDIEAEMEALGEGADTRIKEFGVWGSENIPKDLWGPAQKVAQTAEGFRLLEAMMQKSRGRVMPGNEDIQPPEPVNNETLAKKMRDPRYADPRKRDETYVADVMKFAARVAEAKAKGAA